MNEINKQSVNLREEKLKELQKLMPQLFDEEGKLDTKELELLGKGYPSSITGKYEFNWAGKMSAKRNAYKPSRANLKPDKARSIDFYSTENLIIEGDNLEVLKLLQKSYSSKIKCIYIDPPYNTGHDFVYSDDYSEDKKAYWEKSGTTENGVKIDSNTESQGRYHSNWLNMMYPRLVLARELLKDDGVIFVSIDDNEVHNLRKIMDEVFGEENFVAQIIWEKVHTRKNSAKHFSISHDYIVLYAKNKEKWDRHLLPRENTDAYSNPDNDPKGPWKSDPITAHNFYDANYKIKKPNGIELKRPPGGYWRYSEESINQKIKNNEIIWGEGNSYPMIKRYLSETQGGLVPITLFSRKFAGDSSSAKKEMDNLFGVQALFDYPKPSLLIKRLLQLNTSGNDIALDFFAGSGTTAHAVMDLNKEDGGNRKYILVQLPELIDDNSEAHKAGFKTISDITIGRVKRVSDKIKKEDEGKNIDLGFKVFKLSPSFFPENQFTPDPEKTEEENIKALDEYLEKIKSQMKFEFDEEELLFEILLKDGFKLNFKKEQLSEIQENKVYKITDGEKEVLVCLDDSIENSTLKILEGMKDMRFICLERAVDTTKKWKLKSIFGQNLWVA